MKLKKISNYVIEAWAKEKKMSIEEFMDWVKARPGWKKIKKFLEWIKTTPGYKNLKKFWRGLDR